MRTHYLERKGGQLQDHTPRGLQERTIQHYRRFHKMRRPSQVPHQNLRCHLQLQVEWLLLLGLLVSLSDHLVDMCLRTMERCRRRRRRFQLQAFFLAMALILFRIFSLGHQDNTLLRPSRTPLSQETHSTCQRLSFGEKCVTVCCK